MPHEGFTSQHRVIGRIAAWAVFLLGLGYSVTLLLGLSSLRSPQEPIGDPYFSILELLIVLMASLMIVCMVAVHAYAPPDVKAYSSTALVFMVLLAGITSSVHFVILAVSREIMSSGSTWAPLFLSYTWPSVAYALDILAWDFFFAISMLFAAPVFRVGRLEKTVRILMLASGVLSLAGLIGVPLADMQVRLIGVFGYAAVAPVAFLLLGLILGRSQDMS